MAFPSVPKRGHMLHHCTSHNLHSSGLIQTTSNTAGVLGTPSEGPGQAKILSALFWDREMKVEHTKKILD